MALEFQCCNATLLSLPSNARLFRPSRSSETIAMECERGGTRGEMVGLLESQGGLPKRCRFSALLCRECLACLVYSTSLHLWVFIVSSSSRWKLFSFNELKISPFPLEMVNKQWSKDMGLSVPLFLACRPLLQSLLFFFYLGLYDVEIK